MKNQPRLPAHANPYLQNVLLPKWVVRTIRIASIMILACLTIEAYAEDAPHFERGPHVLHTTFNMQDSRWNFNNDVIVRSKAEKLAIVVVDEARCRETDEADLKHVQGGLGNPLEAHATNSSDCKSAHTSFLAARKKLNGTINPDGDMLFGVTTIHDDELLSLHFVGRSSLGGASGKVYLVSSKAPVRQGTWSLKNRFSQGGAVPGFNGTSTFGP